MVAPIAPRCTLGQSPMQGVPARNNGTGDARLRHTPGCRPRGTHARAGPVLTSRPALRPPTMSSSPPTSPPPRVALGTGLAALPTGQSGVVFTLELQDALPARLRRCARDLLHISDNVVCTEQLTGRMFFAFNGLERDPRQVHTIPECREVLRGLHRRWPYWMHFLAPEPDLWSVLLLCLLPLGPGVRLPNGRIAHELDHEALQNLITELTVAVNELHYHHKVEATASKRIQARAMRAMGRATGART